MKLIDLGTASAGTYFRGKTRMAPTLRGHALHGTYLYVEERFGRYERLHDAASELEKVGFERLGGGRP